MQRRTFLLGAVATALAACASNEEREAQDASEVIDVPMTVVHATPTIDVELDGSPVRCWLDTGGGVVIVDDALAVDPAVVRWTVGGTALDVTIDGVDPITMGTEFFARTGAQAFLPARVLTRHAVTFDYVKGRFRLGGDVEPPSDSVAVPAPVSDQMRFPRVEATVDGDAHGLLLDTGASHCMISDAVLDSWAAAHPDWPVVGAALGTAAMASPDADAGRRTIIVPEVRIGGVVATNVSFVSRPAGTFEEHMSSLMTAPIVGALAGNLLQHSRVDLDPAREVAHLSPRSITVPGRFAAPFNIEWIDGRSRVLDVVGDLPLARGDLVVAVDGRSIEDLPFAEVMERLTRDAAGTINVTTAVEDLELDLVAI